jgi:hypothetical protein
MLLTSGARGRKEVSLWLNEGVLCLRRISQAAESRSTPNPVTSLKIKSFTIPKAFDGKYLLFHTTHDLINDEPSSIDPVQ